MAPHTDAWDEALAARDMNPEIYAAILGNVNSKAGKDRLVKRNGNQLMHLAMEAGDMHLLSFVFDNATYTDIAPYVVANAMRKAPAVVDMVLKHGTDSIIRSDCVMAEAVEMNDISIVKSLLEHGYRGEGLRYGIHGVNGSKSAVKAAGLGHVECMLLLLTEFVGKGHDDVNSAVVEEKEVCRCWEAAVANSQKDVLEFLYERYPQNHDLFADTGSAWYKNISSPALDFVVGKFGKAIEKGLVRGLCDGFNMPGLKFILGAGVDAEVVMEGILETSFWRGLEIAFKHGADPTSAHVNATVNKLFRSHCCSAYDSYSEFYSPSETCRFLHALLEAGAKITTNEDWLKKKVDGQRPPYHTRGGESICLFCAPAVITSGYIGELSTKMLIYRAAKYNKREIIELAVKTGVDLVVHGEGCVSIACEKGYLELVVYLVHNGAPLACNGDSFIRFDPRARVLCVKKG